MLLKSQKGSALVMALLIGFLGTMIGTTLFAVSSANAKQVQQRTNKLQADYYAKSGVNLAIGIIINNDADFLVDSDIKEKTYYGDLNGLSEDNPGDDSHLIEVTISYEDENDSYSISSIGYVRGSGASVAESEPFNYNISRQTLLDAINNTDDEEPGSGNAPQYPALDKIFAVGVNEKSGKALELLGSACISGDVGVNSILANSVAFAYSTLVNDGDLFIGPEGDADEVVSFTGWGRASTNIPDGSIKNLSSIQSFPLPDFPEFPTLTEKDSLEFVKSTKKSNPTATINESGYYSSIDVTSGRVLKIIVANDDIFIRTESLEVSGSSSIVINKTGTGKVVFYVEDTFTLGGSGTINNGGNYDSLNMYYAGTDPINVGGRTKFVGSIYAETADINIQGSGGITGHIITGGSDVDVTGDARANVRALYAPLASLKVTGSGKIKGAVIANDILVSGSGGDRIAYDDSFSTDFFEQLEWNLPDNNDDEEEVTPSLNRIIQSGKWIKPNGA